MMTEMQHVALPALRTQAAALLACLLFLGVQTSEGRHVGRVSFRALLEDKVPDSLNPCLKQSVVSKQSYLIGSVIRPGGAIGEYLTEDSQQIMNPCNSSQQLQQDLIKDNAVFDVFDMQVGEFAVLQSFDVNYMYNVSSAVYRVVSSLVFNNNTVSNPTVIWSEDSAMTLGGLGSVMQEPLVISNSIDEPDSISIIDQFLGPNCTSACNVYMENYLEELVIWDANFNVPTSVNITEMESTCINQFACAWGPGLCLHCVSGLQTGPSRTIHDWFDTAFVQGEGNSTNAQRARACNTFCTPFRYSAWYGSDDFGRKLGSSQLYIKRVLDRPLIALGLFPEAFGINQFFIDYLEFIGIA